MSEKDPKTGRFIFDGKEIIVNLDELASKPSPGEYKLPNGEKIVVEKPEEKV